MEYLRYWFRLAQWSMKKTVQFSGKEVVASTYAGAVGIVGIFVFFVIDDDGSKWTEAMQAFAIAAVSGAGTWLTVFLLLTVFLAPYRMVCDLRQRLGQQETLDAKRIRLASDLKTLTDLHQRLSKDTDSTNELRRAFKKWAKKYEDQKDAPEQQLSSTMTYLQSLDGPARDRNAMSRVELKDSVETLLTLLGEALRRLNIKRDAMRD